MNLQRQARDKSKEKSSQKEGCVFRWRQTRVLRSYLMVWPRYEKSLLCAFRNNVIISWFEKRSFAKTGSDQRKEREDKAVLNKRSLLCSHRVLVKGLVRKE